MLHNMLAIVWALAQSPLAVFFGMIAAFFAISYGIVRALNLQENFS